MRRLAAAIAGSVVLLAGASALAHRGHDVLTVVEIDVESGTVLVTHRMTAHDVEPTLTQIAPEAQPSLDDPDALTALVDYVARRFRVQEGSAPVALTLKKTDLAGDEVSFVYEGRLQAPRGALTIDARMFSDVYPDQRIQVNVRRAGVTRTLRFDSRSDPQTLPAMDPADP